jgi:SHO1 osmosensor
MHRFQISVFGSIAIVFAVIGINDTIFSGRASLDAVAAGWLILAFVNITWTLYFTSEQDSLVLHIFNLMGTGGLTPPGRRRTRTQSLHNMGGNGYQAGYAAPGALGPAGYDNKSHSFAGPMGSGASLKAPSMEARSITGASVNQNTGSIRGPGSAVGADPAIGLASPALSSGAAGVGAGGGIQNVPSAGPGTTSPVDSSAPGAGPTDFVYRAKALYPCESLPCQTLSGGYQQLH